jgi:hypothetical protein
VLEAVLVLLEFSSPSKRIFIGSHSLPPSLVRRIGPSIVWTDSWLSIAGACCDLTGVGAGEEQARKVVAGEASMFREDK